MKWNNGVIWEMQNLSSSVEKVLGVSPADGAEFFFYFLNLNMFPIVCPTSTYTYQGG